MSFAAVAAVSLAGLLAVRGGSTSSPPPTPPRPGHTTSAAPPRFDGGRAFALLRQQVEFGPRVPGSPAHAKALAWMHQQLRAHADTVAVHAFQLADPYGDGMLRLTNLMAGFAPRRTGRIALAAHWDSRPRADRQPGGGVDQPVPGANDGASGVAVLLALAELMRAAPPPVGVDLLFWDGEDYGREGDHQHYLLGSRQFVRDHPQYRPRALILLDMVGDADLHITMEAYGAHRAPELTSRVFDRAAALGLPAFERTLGAAILDDHVPFLEAGIPAVDLIDFDYPAWHTLGDLPAQCAPESLEQVGTLLVSLLYEDFPLDAPR